jgi:hypothetical protein
VSDGGIGAEQNAFDPAKYGGVCADAEREAKNCQDGKSWAAAEHPQTKADVLQEIVDEVDVAGVAAFFLDLLHTSEGLQGSATSFLSIHPLRDEFIDLILQVKLEFLTEIQLSFVLAKQRAQAEW